MIYSLTHNKKRRKCEIFKGNYLNVIIDFHKRGNASCEMVGVFIVLLAAVDKALWLNLVQNAVVCF